MGTSKGKSTQWMVQLANAYGASEATIARFLASQQAQGVVLINSSGSQFKVGDRVRHSSMGDGTVDDAAPNSDYVRVTFDNSTYGEWLIRRVDLVASATGQQQPQAPTPPTSTTAPTFAIGDRIKHITHGEGTVRTVNGHTFGGSSLEVQFDADVGGNTRMVYASNCTLIQMNKPADPWSMGGVVLDTYKHLAQQGYASYPMQQALTEEVHTSWKAEGKCPECGELGKFHNLGMVCSKHGGY